MKVLFSLVCAATVMALSYTAGASLAAFTFLDLSMFDITTWIPEARAALGTVGLMTGVIAFFAAMECEGTVRTETICFDEWGRCHIDNNKPIYLEDCYPVRRNNKDYVCFPL